VSFQTIRNDRKQKRQTQYYKRQAIKLKEKIIKSTESTSQEDPTKQDDPRRCLTKKGHGVFKVEVCRLDKSIDLDKDMMFSGTDNGLVTMTESVPLSVKRFAFYLKLYNSFQALSHFQEDDTDTDLFRLPESFKVKAADIDIGCNFKRIRKKLEKSKHDAEEGKFV
jgi:hypothetical protein